jgi:hypothetical protein
VWVVWDEVNSTKGDYLRRLKEYSKECSGVGRAVLFPDRTKRMPVGRGMRLDVLIELGILFAMG